MLPADPPHEAIEEVHELNRWFLGILRDSTDFDARRFGLPPAATDALKAAGPEQLARAASFPRALFRLRIPADGEIPSAANSRRDEERPGEHVLSLVLLHGARNLSRSSGYWARLLLGLGDDEVARLRAADVAEIVSLSRLDGVVRAAFNAVDCIWPELLTEMRPEYRRRLLLIGFQPEYLPTLAVA